MQSEGDTMARYLCIFYGTPDSSFSDPVCYVVADGEGAAEDKARAVALRDGLTFTDISIDRCDVDADPVEHRDANDMGMGDMSESGGQGW